MEPLPRVVEELIAAGTPVVKELPQVARRAGLLFLPSGLRGVRAQAIQRRASLMPGGRFSLGPRSSANLVHTLPAIKKMVGNCSGCDFFAFLLQLGRGNGRVPPRSRCRAEIPNLDQQLASVNTSGGHWNDAPHQVCVLRVGEPAVFAACCTLHAQAKAKEKAKAKAQATQKTKGPVI